MSRIYQGGEAKSRYEGVDKSVKYNPVQATNSSTQIQGYKEEIAQKARTIGMELSRAQEAENLALRAQQSAERGQQSLTHTGEGFDLARALTHQKLSLEKEHTHERLQMEMDSSGLRARNQVESAKLRAIGTGISSLLNFAGSVVSYGQKMDEIRQQEQRDAEKLALENSELEAAGLGSTFGDANPISEEVMEQGSEANSVLQAEAQATANVTEPMVNSGNVAEENLGVRIRQSTTWKSLEPLRNQGYAAAGMYPIAVQQAKAEGLIRPGAEGYIDAQRFAREFAKLTGVLGAPREIQLKFARIAAATNTNLVLAVTAENTKEILESNQAAWANMASSITDSATSGNIGEAFDQLHQETLNGNIGFNGRQSRAATSTTLDGMLSNLAEEGRTQDIKELRNHVYNPSTGRTLGQDFDAVFDKYEKASRTTAVSNYNLDATERNIETKESIRFFYDNPTPENRRAAIATLRSIGTEEALKEAARLGENGLGYDPQKKFELLEMKQQGIPIPQDMLEQLLRDGTISEAEYKQFATTSVDEATAKKVDAYLKDIGTGLKASMQGKAGPQDLTSAVRAQLNTRYPMLMAELRTRVLAEVKSNPALADSPQELGRIVEAYSQQLLKRPEYRLEADPQKGYYFPGDITPDRRLAHITVAPGVQDFSKLKPEDIFGKLQYPKSEMDASKDRFLTPDELKADVKKALAGETISNRSRLFAKNLGLSSRAFLEMQLEAAGLPSLNSIQQQGNQGGGPHDIPDASSGLRALRGLGFPSKGAAYLAGNIQQESGWHGLRQWGQVAGDGTNRNGGLISWASWTNDSARLGAIERHYGKNIAEIPEIDQLRYMMLEMKRSYPAAFRVFMNPNSSDAALRKASYQYWGYGEEGARFTYAQNLLNTGRI